MRNVLAIAGREIRSYFASPIAYFVVGFFSFLFGWFFWSYLVFFAERRNGIGAYEIESERGRDVRRELARAVVQNGWGLLELRPMRMSLEEIFLQLTTEERDEEVARA